MRLVWMLGLVACGRIGFNAATGSGNGSGSGSGSGDGGVIDPDATTTPGTRLAVRYWTTNDGVRLFASFFDPMIGSRCTFESDSSGAQQRCFPSEALTQFSYADAGCTTPTLRVANGCATSPTLAAIASGSGYQAVTLGAPTTGYLGVISSCTPATDNASYYLVGSAMPDSMFVAAAPQMVALADGLSRLELVADDGSRQNVGYAYQGMPCSIARLTPTTATCVPEAPSIVIGPRMYSDASCTTEVAPFNGTLPPSFAVIGGEATCVFTRYMTTSGMQVLTTLYVRNSSGGCSAITQSSQMYTTVTDVTSTLPVLTRVIDAGTTRLRTWGWVSANGARLEGGLYDTALNAACKPVVDTTGLTTCATTSYPYPVNHVTANCTMPAPAGYALCDGADSATPTAISPTQEFATCNGLGVQISTYTTKATASAGYDAYAGACIQMDLSNATLFTTAVAPYQPSRFVALTLQ